MIGIWWYVSSELVGGGLIGVVVVVKDWTVGCRDYSKSF